MKKKKIQAAIRLFVVPVLLAMGSVAMAQPPGGQGGRPGSGERFDRMVKVLVDSVGINDEQVEKVKEINTKYQKKFEKARQEMQNGADREQMMQTFRTTMQEYDKEVNAVLNDEQKVKYEKVKANRRGQMRRNRPGGPPTGEEGSQRGERGQRGGR